MDEVNKGKENYTLNMWYNVNANSFRANEVLWSVTRKQLTYEKFLRDKLQKVLVVTFGLDPIPLSVLQVKVSICRNRVPQSWSQGYHVVSRYTGDTQSTITGSSETFPFAVHVYLVNFISVEKLLLFLRHIYTASYENKLTIFNRLFLTSAWLCGN